MLCFPPSYLPMFSFTWTQSVTLGLRNVLASFVHFDTNTKSRVEKTMCPKLYWKLRDQAKPRLRQGPVITLRHRYKLHIHTRNQTKPNWDQPTTHQNQECMVSRRQFNLRGFFLYFKYIWCHSLLSSMPCSFMMTSTLFILLERYSCVFYLLTWIIYSNTSHY